MRNGNDLWENPARPWASVPPAALARHRRRLLGWVSTFMPDPEVQRVPFASEFRDRGGGKTQVERAAWGHSQPGCIWQASERGQRMNGVSRSLAAPLEVLIGISQSAHAASAPLLGL